MIRNLILLGGNNPDNAAWLQKLGASLAKDYTVYLHEYEHWQRSGDITFNGELDALKLQVSTLKDYAIVGKSAGGLLALMGFNDGTFVDVKKIIIIGFPASWATDKNIAYRNLLAQDRRIGYIQATNDPKCTYATLAKMLGSHNTIEKYYSKNHTYSKVKTISRKVRLLLNS